MSATTLLVAIFFVVYVVPASGRIQYRNLPDRLAVCYNKHYKACSTQTKIGLSIFHRCMSEYQWKSGPEKEYPGKGPSQRATNYISSLAQQVRRGGTPRRRGKRQAGMKVRKEYRMLTDDERRRYHRAIQTLKRVQPGETESRYDMIASYHTAAELNAHGGCNFPGWHKFYLLMYEEALQSVDPSVTLPYWDSTLDQNMEESAQSIIWDGDFLGGGDGAVTTGPFANWQTTDGPLTRNIGVPDTQLYTEEQIFNTTRRTRMHEICNGQTDSEVDPLVDTGLEWHHGDVHVWVGGQMSSLQTAAEDPVFFMHHAFVDLVWGMFRENSRRSGVDIQRDYPTANYGDPQLHGPDAPLGFNLGLTVRDGINDESVIPEARYRYDPRPTCSRNRGCGSNKLNCEQRGRNYVCVSKTVVQYRSDIQIEEATRGRNINTNNGNTVIISRPNPPNNRINPGRTRPQRRTTPWSFRNRVLPLGIGNRNRVAIIDQCPVVEHEHKPIQNTFCADGNPDTRNWVYIPIRVLAQRTPDFKKYGSYPVRNGQLRTGSDIYSAQGYSKLSSSLEFGNPKAFDKCKTDHDPAGEIYIRTDGINYEGTYTEYAIIDQRLPLAISVAYVAVKAPEPGKPSDVVLTAYDSCGRICIPSCLDTNSNTYKPCSGAITLDSNSPLMYSKSFADTVLNIYDVKSQKHCPQVKNDRIHVSFFCDYTNDWPWMTALTQPGAQPHIWQQQLRKNAASLRRRNNRNSAIRRPDLNGRHSLKKSKLNKCDLGNGCIIEKANCNSPCQEGKNYVCLKKCNMFATCESGRYFVKKCFASHYSKSANDCQPGRGHCTYSEWNLGLRPNLGSRWHRVRGRSYYRIPGRIG